MKRFKKKYIGAGMILAGLFLLISPSVGLLTFVSGPTTIYCSDWNPQEWSYILFSNGADITPLPGCYIETGYSTHTCTTGSAVCLERDSNNFCNHYQCPVPQQTTCSNTCPDLQKPYPDCSCYSPEQPFVDKSIFQIIGGLLVFGGILVVRK